jgi:hypothetical protein
MRLPDVLFAVIAFVGSAMPAAAQMTQHSVPVEILAVGGYCDPGNGDRFLSAPETPQGQIEQLDAMFDFVELGDSRVAHPGLGVGLRTRVDGYGAGSDLTSIIVDPTGRMYKWVNHIPGSGILEVGMLPEPGKTLFVGTYRFTIRDSRSILFSYLITLDREEDTGPCKPATPIS